MSLYYRSARPDRCVRSRLPVRNAVRRMGCVRIYLRRSLAENVRCSRISRREHHRRPLDLPFRSGGVSVEGVGWSDSCASRRTQTKVCADGWSLVESNETVGEGAYWPDEKMISVTSTNDGIVFAGSSSRRDRRERRIG